MAKEWWDATLISSVSASYVRGQSRLSLYQGQRQHLQIVYPCVPLWGSFSVLTAVLLSPAPPGQFLLEESRLLEAAEMAEKAARLDGGEFDVVFSAAHMLRWVFDFFVFFFYTWDDVHSPSTRNLTHFILCSWDGWATVFHGYLLSTGFVRRLTLLLSQCDLLGCTLFCFSRCSGSLTATGLSNRAVWLCILVCSFSLSPTLPHFFSVGPGSYMEICFQKSAWLSRWAWAT